MIGLYIVLIISVVFNIGFLMKYVEACVQKKSIVEHYDKEIKRSEDRVKELNDNVNRLEDKESFIKSQIEFLDEDYRNKLNQQDLKYSNKLAELISEYNEQKADVKKKYEDAAAAYKETYLSTLKDCANNFVEYKQANIKELEDMQRKLEILQASYRARVEIAKHEQEDNDKRNYYKWQLAEPAIEDIKRMEIVRTSLSNPSIVDKVLWKTYYEKATNDLITRVVGKENPCGIYKITNTLNEKVYIGQSVEVVSRLKTHVKSAVGAIPASNNKLYTSMRQDGLWNFTWEIIEECPREQLNEREAYWIEFYNATDWGMNSQKGNKS